jgi:serine palmitoyltransferase
MVLAPVDPEVSMAPLIFIWIWRQSLQDLWAQMHALYIPMDFVRFPLLFLPFPSEETSFYSKLSQRYVNLYTIRSINNAFLNYYSDEGVNFATLQGIILSRSSFKSFKHNDTNDLKRALKEIIAKDNEKPVRNRRFIVINGVYENYGDIAPLEKIVQLAKQYKFRMIMDDSFGFGVLGKTGKGTVEHCNVNINDIDILTANLENSLASAGGFCVGTKQIVEHQRLSGLGYCFSASLPPFTSMASMQALSRLEQKPELMKQLTHNIKLTVDAISKALPECLRLDGSYYSPVMHIRYKGTNDSNITLKKFKKVVSKALERNLAVVCPKYSQRELNPPPPSIRISVSSSHTEDDINYCASVLRDILHQEFKT